MITDKINLLGNFNSNLVRLVLLAAIEIIFMGAVFGQTSDYVVVSNIVIEGNKKTKDRVILREMDITPGDTLLIAEMNDDFERNRQFIFNTSLFQSVKINVKNWNTESQTLDLQIELIEDWYIYPIPIFALADRNLNVWLKEFNASLKRVSYGMRFYNFNTTGNGDRLTLLAQFGYEKRFDIRYNRPNINKAQTLGWSNTLRYQSRKELFYATIGNKQAFNSNDNEDQFEAFRYRSVLTLRPQINTYQALEFEYINTTISDTIALYLNPDYFLDGKSNQRVFNLKYSYTSDQRNFRTYPTKGSFLQVSLHKQGLGIHNDVNQLRIEPTYAKYFEMTPGISLETLVRMRYSFNRKLQPFSNYRGIGFNRNDIRGYELYVIDALDFGYISTSLRFQVLKKNFNFGKIIPISTFRSMPIQLMFTINNDMGYANDPFFADTNTLANRWLWGGGIGLDLMLYNDYVFQVEYNRNQLSDSGLFLKVKLPF